MTPTIIASVMIGALLLFIALRASIALAMALVGAAGYIYQTGWYPFSAYLQSGIIDRFVSYDLAIVPLFVLMGQVATRTGLSRSIFEASNAWLGHLRGGLAMASVAGCAVFGSICGSSVATASTMARVALPEMKRYGYSGALSSGSLAAGGTLGILIPPSIVLIIYALITEQNIVKLFLAATMPGLLAIAGFFIAIALYVRMFPKEGPRHDPVPLRDRIKAVGKIWHVALIFIVVLGGIYGGFFTPAEGASIGVILTVLAGLMLRSLGLRVLVQCVVDTASTTAMIFTIVFAADIFNVALALTRTPSMLADWVGALGYAPIVILIIIVLFYLLMGCVMDSLSMVLLTVPVFFPAMMTLDFGLTLEYQAMWFAIITLIVVELGMITPPVGLNLFVISQLAPGIPTRQIFRGALPFIAAELVRVSLILAFPWLTFGLVKFLSG